MKKRFLALLLTLIMVFALIPAAAFAADGTEAENTVAAEPAPVRAAEGAKAGGSTYLAFTSDVHNGHTGASISNNRLSTWLTAVQPKYQNNINVMGFCGDMGGGDTNTSTFWTYTQEVMENISNRGMSGVYTTGNHEYQNGSFSSTSNSPEVRGRYVLNNEGRAVSDENYVIYCLGTNSNNWRYDDSQITSLANYIKGVNSDKVIIVLTHFPLHNYGMHTTTNTQAVVDALNAAALGTDGISGTEDDKKIVLLWGHSHSEGDPNYDQIWAPGDTLPNDNKTKTNFFYAAAGSMADYEYGSSSSVKGKGLVLEITADNKLSFTYYDADGNNVTEGGTYTEKDPVAIESATIEQGTVPGENGVMMVEETIPARKTLQLTYTTVPADATVKSVTWSSDNTAVATVGETTGLVRGVSVGTAKITATLNDGITRGQVVAEVLVNIGDPLPGPVYVRSNTLEVGKKYIIANKNSGEGYALTNNNGSVAKTAVNIADDTIYLDEENEAIVFTTGGSGTTVTTISNNGRYIQASNYSLTLSTSAPSNRTHAYSDDYKLTQKSGNSTYYIYYSTYNGGNFSSSTSATSSTSPREVYLYEEVTVQVPVTGITLDKATAEVEVGRTVKLNATVAPSNATNKNVVWTSSDDSKATVDQSGNVKGIAEGLVVITAASAENSSIKATCTVDVKPRTSADPEYVIVIDDYALSYDRSPNTATSSESSNYTYTGLAGVAYTDGDIAADNIRWTFVETDGGYYILSSDGKYLNAAYTSGSNSGQGNLKLDSTRDVWVLDDGYSIDSGSVNGSYLKSTNATASTPDRPKYLGYEESPANLFTVRSKENADTVTIGEASDPVAVTGVTLNKTSLTLEAKKSETLTATVTPTNATNKNVTWSSSDASVATVDQNGRVKGVAVGTAVITVTTVDGGKTASCNVTVTPSTQTEKTYVITVGSFALSTDTTTDTLSNNNGAYVYSGLAGAPFDPSEDPADNISWILEEVDGVTGGYYIKSLDGRYLNATYTSVSNPTANNPTRGVLKLDDTPDVWVMDGTLEAWEIDGSMLKSTNASATASSPKYLAYEAKATESSSSATINLFTVRSENNADETTLIDPTATIIEKFVETDKFVNGKEFIIAVTKDSGSVYAVANVTGTSSGNTGTATLTVVPANGSDPAYIEEADSGAIWTFTSSDNYLTNNGRMLSYESGTYLPRASGSGRAITYTSGNKLQIASRYLTCDNGTFGTSTSSSSGASVRLFVKTIEIVTCEHDWGDPVWTWTGDGVAKSRAVEGVSASATFTCTKCGETETKDAEIAELENGMYEATVIGPDNKTYKDTRAKAASGEYKFKFNVSKAYAKPGDTIEFQLILEGPADHLANMMMDLLIDSNGLKFVNGSGEPTEAIAAAGMFVEFDNDSLVILGAMNDGDLHSENDIAIATFECTVKEGFSGTATVTLDKQTWELSDINSVIYNEHYDVIPGTVTVTPLTVTFYKNYEGADPASTTQTVYKNVADKLDANNFTRTGYTFKGWNTAADGTGIDYANGADITLTENLTLYAQWEADKVTVTFNANGHGTAPDAQTIDYGTTATEPTPAPTADGYTFGGWYTEEACTNVYSFSTPVTGDKTLYAKWTPTAFAITYNLDGGTLPEDAVTTYTIEDAVTLPTPTKDGYGFNGWFEAEDFSGTAVTVIPAGSTGDKTFYAKWTAGAYTIEYVLDGGTNAATNPASYTVETDTITLAAATKTGYTFGGWYSDAEFTTKVTQIAKGSTGNIKLYAKWTINQYTITFNTDGGSEVAAITQDYGTAVTAPAAPTKEGYTFAGWTPAVPATMPAENVTITATWTAIEYSITYVLNDGTLPEGAENPATYTIESDAITLINPTKAGYTFAGWTGTDLTEATTTVTIAKGSIGNRSYTATWTANSFTVEDISGTFTYNGQAQTPAVVVKDGETVLVEGVDYTVAYTSNTNAGTATATITGIGSYAAQEDVAKTFTIGAKEVGLTWSPLTFAYDGQPHIPTATATGVIEGDTVTVTVTGEQTAAGTYTATATALSNPNYKLPEANATQFTINKAAQAAPEVGKTDETISGKNDGTITGLEPGMQISADGGQTWTTITEEMLTEDGTLENQAPGTYQVRYAESDNYAASEAATVIIAPSATKLVVTFSTNGGNAVEDQQLDYNGKVAKPAAPTKTGYTFAGWFADEALATEFDFTAGITQNTTVYAKWTANSYTVAFDKNDAEAEGTMANQSFTYDAEQKLTKNAFTKANYTFAGWNTAADGTGTAYTDEQNVKNLTAESGATVTLYAQWTQNAQVTITFNKNAEDATGTMADQTIYSGVASALNVNAFARTGYTFAGWATSADAAEAAYEDGATVTFTENTTLYAVWTVNNYTITWNMDDGSLIDTTTVAYGAVPAHAAPTKAATAQYTYTFAGWSDGTTTYEADKLPAVTGSATYTAVFTQTVNKYTVTFVDEDGTTVILAAAEYDYGTAWVSVVKPSDPAKTGYTFAGWTGAPETVTENVTVKASYTAVEYTITYNLDGGTLPADAPVKYTIESDAITLPTPTKDGYTFAGWFDNEDLEGTAVTTIAKGSTGNKVFWAKWEESSDEGSYVMSFGTRLEGQLSLRAFIVFTEKVLKDSAAYIQLSYTYAETPKNPTLVTEKPVIADAATDTQQSTGIVRRVFSNKFFIAQLNDEVNVKLFNGSGKQLPLSRLIDGEYVDMTETGVIETPWSYLERYIAIGTDANMKDLARAIEYYGTAAQLQFDYHTDLIPEGAVGALNEAIGREDIDTKLARYEEKTTGTLPAGITKYTKNLTVESDHSLVYQFQPESGASITDYRFWIDSGNGYEEVEATINSNGRFCIRKSNIASGELSKTYKFKIAKVGNESNAFEITASALSYAYAVTQNTSVKAELKTLARALYLYSYAADKYFKTGDFAQN